MTETFSALLKSIREQTSAHPEFGPVSACGEQILHIAYEDDSFAGIILKDLENPEMSVEKCAGRIKALADTKHQKEKGSCVCVTPEEADNVIRRFYGLPEADTKPEWEREEAQNAMASAKADVIADDIDSFLSQYL